MKPYGLISDTHNHAWSAFATVLDTGVNSRLQMTLDETRRCASEVRKAGGNTIIHAGDLFHVRGSIAPSVLNPTKDLYRDLVKDGFRIIIDAGNHDLEGKEAVRVSSAITALEDVGCKVVNSKMAGLTAMERVILVPWIQKIDDLKAAIEEAAAVEPGRDNVDLILHAPIDGAIEGLPAHGLEPEYLASLGFRRVFAGHYHNHKKMYDGDSHAYGTDVYSIGALTHLTWSDVGSKAGFLIVSDSGVKWFKSHAPEFVELTAETDPDEIPLIVDGNYVKVKMNTTKQREIEEMREFLVKNNAKGVVVMAQKASSVAARSGATIKAGASMEVSVNDYIKSQAFANSEKLSVLCQSILTDARGEA